MKEEVKTKFCPKCDTEKPLTDFHGIKVKASYCKPCVNESRRKGGDYHDKIKQLNDDRYKDKKKRQKHILACQSYQQKLKKKNTLIYAIDIVGEGTFVGITNNPTMRLNVLVADKKRNFDRDSFLEVMSFREKVDAELTYSVLVTDKKYGFLGGNKRATGWSRKANGHHHRSADKFVERLNYKKKNK